MSRKQKFTVHKEISIFIVRHDDGAGTIQPVATVSVTEAVPTVTAKRIAGEIALRMTKACELAERLSNESN